MADPRRAGPTSGLGGTEGAGGRCAVRAFVVRLLVRHSLTLTAIVVAAVMWAATLLGQPERLPRSLVRESLHTGPTCEELEACLGVAESAIELQ